jgi:hypothetical protein
MKKMKSKISVKRIGKYFWELSVVVVGIAITLSANNLINILNEKKDLHLHLDAIKLELEENLQTVNDRKAYFERTTRYALYLVTRNPNKSTDDPYAVHPDSVKNNTDITYDIHYFVYKTSAFEMFKTSGMMRLTKNEKLMKSIWDSYSGLETLKVYNDNVYTPIKLEELKSEWKESLAKNEKPIPMYDFFTTGAFDFGLLEMFKDASDNIEQLLSQLNN